MSDVFAVLASPVGPLTLVAGEHGLCAVHWVDDRPGRVPARERAEQAAHPVLREAARQLADYFAGQRRRFDLPLDFRGTAFQRAVWQALTRIPFGETRTYGQIARALGRPAATRAVGAANGRNPLAIVAPCHRVIGASGTLTGFAGGLDAKARLLALEGLTVGAAANARARRVSQPPPQADLFGETGPSRPDLRAGVGPLSR